MIYYSFACTIYLTEQKILQVGTFKMHENVLFNFLSGCETKHTFIGFSILWPLAP